MPIALTFKKRRPNENRVPDYLVGVVLSGTYPTGGETVDFTTLTQIKVNKLRKPDVVWVNSTFGYGIVYVPGTNMSDGKLKVFTAANVEHANAAYAANVSGDTAIVMELVVDSL
jgi:hypothetical protein